MMTLAYLAREIGLPYTSLYAMLQSGKLVPDACSGRYSLFFEENLEKIAASILQHRPDFKISSRIGRTKAPLAVSSGAQRDGHS